MENPQTDLAADIINCLQKENSALRIHNTDMNDVYAKLERAFNDLLDQYIEDAEDLQAMSNIDYFRNGWLEKAGLAKVADIG